VTGGVTGPKPTAAGARVRFSVARMRIDAASHEHAVTVRRDLFGLEESTSRSRRFVGKAKPNEAMPIKRAARNELDFLV
jgi:hypothetical protein